MLFGFKSQWRTFQKLISRIPHNRLKKKN
jgi:hypothetical protein